MNTFLFPPAAKRAIAGIITAAGMKEILNRAGQPSGSIFIGTINQFVSAMNNLVMTTWVRPVPGVPDVGDLWELTSAEASQDINYAEFLSPFHG